MYWCIDECVNVFIWTHCNLILVIYVQYYNNVILNYYYFFFQYGLKMNTCEGMCVVKICNYNLLEKTFLILNHHGFIVLITIHSV